jgi:uncharacterized protein (DUF983 family)
MAYLNVRSRGAFWALAHLRCPRCHHGRVFNGILAMNERCPVCLLQFEREPGYFMGAMYISYLMSFMVVAASLTTIGLLFPRLPDVWLCLGTCGMLIPFVPVIFRYSRVIWMTFDRAIDA